MRLESAPPLKKKKTRKSTLFLVQPSANCSSVSVHWMSIVAMERMPLILFHLCVLYKQTDIDCSQAVGPAGARAQVRSSASAQVARAGAEETSQACM